MTHGFGQGGFGAQLGASLNNSVQKIITDCLVAAGINSDDTVYRERALVFLNMVYLNRLKGRHWKFAQREAFLDLKAPYTTGTVDVTQDSYGVTLTGGTFDATMHGQTFVPPSSNIDLYRVALVNTGTSLNLSAKFSGDSQTAANYQILFDRMTLEPGILAVRSISMSGFGEIRPLGAQEFRNKKSQNPTLTGIPQFYTLVNAEEQAGVWTLEFFPAPDKRYTAHVEYSVRPVGLEDEDDCFTIIPPHHMDVLHYGVLAEIYRIQENPAMLDAVRTEAAQAWARFASDQEMTDSVARIQPGRRYFNRAARRQYRGYYGLNWFGKVDA